MESSPKIKVLFVDDDISQFIKGWQRRFNNQLTFITVSELTQAAVKHALDKAPDITVVILDLLDADMNLVGVDLLKAIPQDRVQVIIYSQITDNPVLVNECDAAGAYDYFGKPSDGLPDFDAIGKQIRYAHKHAIACRQFWKEKTLRKFPIESGIYGRSDAIRDVIDQIQQVGGHDVNILITGETGTGKELVARGIHQKSGLNPNVFFPQNIAAVADELLHSELFGHTKGAFTGATEARKGLFREAGEGGRTGTVFLDEIGDAPKVIQVALLRVVQERKVKPLGSDTEYPPGDGELNFRLICATNRDLQQRIKADRFRLDLYHRIAEIVINVPSLRERAADDIGILTHQFFAIHRRTLMASRLTQTQIDPQDLALMKQYRWSGNVRELDGIIKRSVILEHLNGETFRLCEADRARMRASHNPVESGLQGNDDPPHVSQSRSKTEATIPFPQSLEAIQRDAIRLAWECSCGNITRAAQTLGMNRQKFRRWSQKYGIDLSK